MSKSKRQKVQDRAEYIASWEEADRALAEIAIAQQSIAHDEAAYNQREQITRQKMTDKHSPMRSRIEELRLGLKNFCEERRAEFGKRKSVELQHGILSFRLGTPRVGKDRRFTWEAVLELVRRSVWAPKIIRTKEELNKESVLELSTAYDQGDTENGMSPDALRECGMVVEQEETFAFQIKLAVDEGGI